MKDYNGTNSDYKGEEGLNGSLFYLISGSSCSGGEWFLFFIDEPNWKFDFWIFLLSLKAHWSSIKH